MAYTGPVFNFEHNWTDPVVERISWMTAVLRKRDGSEQRIRNRQKPRRTVEYKAFVGGADDIAERRRFDALVWKTQDQQIMVPMWTDVQSLPALLASGSGHVDLPPLEGYDFAADAGYLIFWHSSTSYEVLEIDALNNSNGRITFKTNTVTTWAKGTRVVPAWLCLYDPLSSDEVYASDIKSTQVKFELIVPAVAPTASYRATTPTLDTYRSHDVFDMPGMDGTNQRTLERTVARIDFSVGQFKNDSIQAAPFGGIDCNLQLFGRSEIAEFLGWMNMRVGRQKAFWFPTWEQDFNFIELVDDNIFAAEPFGYEDTYNLGESRRDLAITATDGARTYRRITAVSSGVQDEFTLDGDFPEIDLDRISFLRYCRLDHDEIELNWQTNDDVSVALKFRELIKTA